jgi:aryl-alcohol dehydrogenase-like predicted oxidoreductase
MTTSAASHRTLGRTGMQVTPLALGAMMFGAIGNRDHDDCIRVIHRALDAGINLVDTADVYSAGESEVIVGKALAGRRDDVILATKCHFPVAQGPFDPNPVPNTWGNSRRHIVKACEDSLRRLGTDWIDLYQIHRPDPSTHIDETLGALSDLVRAGKVRAIGCSTFPPDRTMEAAWVADRRGHVPFATEQPPYSIFTRWIERDLLPTTERLGMGTLVWGPLNGGWLSGTYRAGGEARSEGRARRQPARFDPTLPANQRKVAVVEELVTVAEELGTTLAKLAIAWTLEHPGVTCALIGPRTMEHLETVLGADELRLPVEVLDRIDELVPPGLNVDPAETHYVAPWLRPGASQRRRP